MFALLEAIIRLGFIATLVLGVIISLPILCSVFMLTRRKTGSTLIMCLGLVLYSVPWKCFPSGPGIFLAPICYLGGMILSCWALEEGEFRMPPWLEATVFGAIVGVGWFLRDWGPWNMFG
jgi:hypothetical protein